MNRYKVLITILSFFCSLLPALLYSQVDTAWVRRYNGPGNGYDEAHAIALDDVGNVYVTGYSTGSGTGSDYATIKYNSDGDTIWVQRYNGPGNNNDWAYSLAVDGQGNVYVTGYSTGSGTSYDYATIKYNSAGVEQWVQRYNGPGNDYDVANAIAVDGQGNVYVTGISRGSTTFYDYATIKYNSAGVEQWVQRYNGPGNDDDAAYSLAVDGQGNVYVTGNSFGSGTWFDYATIKYNSAGVEQWVARYNGPGNSGDEALSLAVDGQGNVYVTGSSYGSGTSGDYATIKYNSDGDTIWVRRYDGPGNSDDGAYSLAVDGQGNVYVTGYSVGSGIYLDYATIKYNSAGVEQWVAGYNGPGNSDDVARSLAVDGQGNVYVTGISRGSTTFYDYATIKYNSTGVEQWVQRYNGPGNGSDWAYSLAVDGQGNVYVTGYSAGTSAYPYNYDYATIKYVQTQGIEEIEIATPSARNDFVVYPNPAKTYFTVRLPKTADRSEIKIFDVNGKIVKSEELKGKNNRVSLNGIKNGVYFVQVTTPLSLRANSGGAAIPQTKTKKLIVAK
jgi:uncharacterized delta-60 repeat protein